ncbi:MAG TPA: hypothetical protein VNU71_20865, partial [Burkholderiaceae bacterium]|nr:hypothetical protein [Burkholderiaceae bacterium]
SMEWLGVTGEGEIGLAVFVARMVGWKPKPGTSGFGYPALNIDVMFVETSKARASNLLESIAVRLEAEFSDGIELIDGPRSLGRDVRKVSVPYPLNESHRSAVVRGQIALATMAASSEAQVSTEEAERLVKGGVANAIDVLVLDGGNNGVH